MQDIGEFLTGEANGLIIADTYHELSRPNPNWSGSLEWFSFKRQPGPHQLFPFLRKKHYNVQTYSALLGAATPYPTTIMLTSIANPLTLACGMDLNSHPQVLDELLERVRQLMVGVFDERSMLVWRRAPF